MCFKVCCIIYGMNHKIIEHTNYEGEASDCHGEALEFTMMETGYMMRDKEGE